ncbi:MAG: 50S ribosomal protein L23 [Candidatus Caenarcaniphilales bacterium]|nr:50S ribosomal protein L23 [Candidatus Caenarcaniphilales bacterium]
MNNLKQKRSILEPVITFKSTQLAQNKCYTFRVRPDASKDEIAEEFSKIFKGKVNRVNVTWIRSHKRRTRKGHTKPADQKKAYIWSEIELDIFPKL